MSNFQHAGDSSGIQANVENTLQPLLDANHEGRFGAAAGYLTASTTQINFG